MNYNASVKHSTGYALFELLYGRNVKTQLALPPVSDSSEDMDSIREAAMIEVHMEAARDAMDRPSHCQVIGDAAQPASSPSLLPTSWRPSLAIP
mmetsp:Transcript_2099/g.4805  ORF Transcript_2099/g.4805 Transcript_2099/m.4805 type:complete len:94 (-) Transcript_2099:560-841(-)